MKKISLLILTVSVVLSGSAQVICIDAGHGYGPVGENLDGRTIEEITTNCEVALRLDTILKEKGYTVVLTRTNSDTGSWLSLTQRAELADNYESERLLSIHCNAGGGTGTETFWCYINSPNRAIDSIFSSIVQEQMALQGEWTNRRSTEDEPYLGFHLGVLKGITPGCLNEIGFVDTPADLEKLLNNSWRKKFAEAYASAIDLSFEVDYPSSGSNLKNSEVKVFPNPFTDRIDISLPVELNGDVLCSFISPDGRLIKSIFIRQDEVSAEFSVSTEELKEGFYILKITSQNSDLFYSLLKL